MLNQVLLIQKLNIEVENKVLLKDISISMPNNGKVGLIGPNGSGKTSLLNSVINSYKEVQISGSYYYVPQLDLEILNQNSSLYMYISKYFDEWWKVLETFRIRFNGKELDPEQKLNTLSGGELTKINLSIAYLINADLLILDEPTNHLDKNSLDYLIKFLNEYKKSFIVVSHDVYFLDNVVNTIWAIEDQTINIYGGNYTYYKEQQRLKTEGQLRQYEAKKKDLDKINKAIHKENQRASRSIGMNEKYKHDRSMPAIVRGGYKNTATLHAGQIKDRLEVQQSRIQEETNKLKPKVIKKAYLDISSNSGKHTLINLTNTELKLNNSKLLSIPNFVVTAKDRVLIEGNNGSGKTSLVKALLKFSDYKLEGEIYISNALKTAYISQKYEIVDTSLSLVENVSSINKELPYQEIRKYLGNFLFLTEDDVNKKAKVLSGGEVARLAFTMVTTGNIDLLILDEPTNNLDINTIEAITNALIDFKGAIILISHNQTFINDIGINKKYLIKEKVLTED